MEPVSEGRERFLLAQTPGGWSVRAPIHRVYWNTMSRLWDGFGRTAEFRALMIHVLEWFRAHRAVASGPVLDVGCGTGLWATALAHDGWSVVGIDLASGMLRRAQARTRVVGPGTVALARADLTAGLPFASHSFRAALCIGVLHVVIDPVAALSELRRVLAPGGMLVVTTPGLRIGARQLWSPAGILLRLPRLVPGWRRRVRSATRGELEALMAGAGFDVTDGRVVGGVLSILASSHDRSGPQALG